MPGDRNDLTDVAGIGVGHHHRRGRGWLTGTTVIVPPTGTVGSVDVRGGAPGTRETDLLDPRMMVHHVDAVVLTGGSAFGLAAADGVMEALATRGRGFRVGPGAGDVVPIVPAAVLFDLGRGGGPSDRRPDRSFGARAASRALSPSRAAIELGSVGAGAGARAGGLKGGIGSASIHSAGGIVAALVAVNAAGSTVDLATGELWAARLALAEDAPGLRRPGERDRRRAAALLRRGAAVTSPRNTTLAVIATDLELDKAACHKLAGVGHDGLARAIDPVHLQVDGDVVFALATGSAGPPRSEQSHAGRGRDRGAGEPSAARSPMLTGSSFDRLLADAANAVARAVVRAMLAAGPGPSAGRGATPSHGIPAYLDLFPSALGRRRRPGA